MARLFTFMAKLLKRQGRNNDLAMVQQRMDPKVTGTSCFDWFSSQSQWHADIATRIIDNITKSLCRTHITDGWRKLWQSNIGGILVFLCQYASERYAQEMQRADASNAVKWFLDTCTLAQAETACLELAQHQEVRNDLVKSQLESHHARLYWSSIFFQSRCRNASRRLLGAFPLGAETYYETHPQ